MRAQLPRLLLSLTLFTVSAPSQAGFGGSDPLELHIHCAGLRGVRVAGRVKAVAWRGRDATSAPRPTQAALAGFTAKAPPGDWAEMILVLDGPVTVTAQTDTGAPVHLTLQVDRLVVPLQDPAGGEEVALDLILPDWLAEAAGDGLDVQPGDALHDRLVAALRDGALGVSVR